MTPRKLRLVAGLIKGMNVEAAGKQLNFLTKRAALPLNKLLNSAAANAKNNFKTEPAKLFVKNVIVNPGPVLKRNRPRSRGMAHPIAKRTSHVEIILEQKIQNPKHQTPNKSKYRNSKS